MSPYLGPSREAVLKQLAQKKPRLPITLGRNEPQATIELRDGVWSLAQLEMDHDAAKKAGEAALAAGEMWMHESTWQFLKPGKVLASAPTLEEFVKQLQALSWKW